jgi:4-aminobutyrate aminotransferase/(S)-3-amino-2-methylpropionate transaminase
VITIADEIWTGLGRCGRWFASFDGNSALKPDLVCLGKGLGGGLPLSALVGRRDVLTHWSQPHEVVHTSTFAGAPLACASAVATLDVLRRFNIPARSEELGAKWVVQLRLALQGLPVVVRGSGLMVGIDLGQRPKAASRAMSLLLDAGYIVSTGGTDREVLVLTPPLVIEETALMTAIPPLREAITRVLS